MLQVLLLAAAACALPAPEADPQWFAGHPLTYAAPYVTYHAPTCTTEIEEIKGQSCVTKPVTECNDIEVPSHNIKVENVCQNITTAGCTPVLAAGVTTLPAGIAKRDAEAEADPQLLYGLGLGVIPQAVPYHQCVNTVAEVCYPVQSIEETTITEKSCLLRAEVECTEVVVATIPRVTCVHEDHTKPAGEAAGEAAAVEVEA